MRVTIEKVGIETILVNLHEFLLFWDLKVKVFTRDTDATHYLKVEETSVHSDFGLTFHSENISTISSIGISHKFANKYNCFV